MKHVYYIQLYNYVYIYDYIYRLTATKFLPRRVVLCHSAYSDISCTILYIMHIYNI